MKTNLLLSTLLIVYMSFFPRHAEAKSDSIIFHDALSFEIMGKGFTKTASPYHRLPSWVKDSVRTQLWDLSLCTAGMSIRFRTNSSQIAVEYTLLRDAAMNHMAMTGIKGIDLYALMDDGTWRYLMTGRPQGKQNKISLIKNMKSQPREFMLYLPLYDGIEKLAIGVDEKAVITPPFEQLPKKGSPLVVYGTSITQGGCASRPGMAYTNILSRMLNRECINLGFSGNGRQDMAMARAIAKLDNKPGCILIDCIPNCTLDEVKTKTIPFVSYLRESYPDVPIVMIEGPYFPNQLLDQHLHNYLPKKNDAFYQAYEQMKRENPDNLYFFESQSFSENDYEGTVDAIHLTDLGFLRMAESLYPLIQELMIR